MGIDHLIAAASATLGSGHPFALDVAIGIVYGVAIGFALSLVRSGTR
jgi:hypothetical protein